MLIYRIKFDSYNMKNLKCSKYSFSSFLAHMACTRYSFSLLFRIKNLSNLIISCWCQN